MMSYEILPVDYAAKLTNRRSKAYGTFWEWMMVASFAISSFSALAYFAYFAPSPCYSRVNMARAIVGKEGSVPQAIEMFASEIDRYPASLDELFQIVQNAPADASFRGPFILDEQALTDPWGHPMLYDRPSKRNVDRFDFWSPGPNGIDESSDGDDDDGDDIGNWQ